jgi:transglycosylase-like protein with SLT domain
LKGITGYLGTDREPKPRGYRSRRISVACLLAVVASATVSVSARAANPSDPAVTETVSPTPAADPPQQAASSPAHAAQAGQTALFKAVVRALVEKEVQNTGLPADIADAVVHVESNYDPSTVGGVGEIGLMQIRPETAAMLGFRGSNDELARPETNIHYGVIYLSKAWRLANGDLCRALMKYRAGHGEETMTPRSVTYCQRARSHLAALGSPFALGGAVSPVSVPPIAPTVASAPSSLPSKPVLDSAKLASPTAVYAHYRQGTAAASQAFWAAHDARVRAITARIESKWRRVASR